MKTGRTETPKPILPIEALMGEARAAQNRLSPDNKGHFDSCFTKRCKSFPAFG